MKIKSNGSKWFGEPPDPIEKLSELLESRILDPDYNWIETKDGTTAIGGNFLCLSHAFHVEGTQEEMAPLVEAMERNRKSDGYWRACGCPGADELAEVEA